MSDETENAEAVEEQRRAREHEEKAKEREPAERAPDDGEGPDRPAPPGQAEQPRG